MEVALDEGRHGSPGVHEAEGELERQGREEDPRRLGAASSRSTGFLHLPPSKYPVADLRRSPRFGAALTGALGHRGRRP